VFPRRWISPKETSEYLSIHLQTVYSLISRGIIPATRIGRSVRVDLKALEEALETIKRGGATRERGGLR